MSTFSVGDVVSSKLGEVPMTITAAGPQNVGIMAAGRNIAYGKSRSDLVECTWFKGKECLTKRYSVAELELIKPAVTHSLSEGDIVTLASGGPKMLIEKCGPIEVGGALMASPSRGVVKVGGSMRYDLAACKWDMHPKDGRKRFPIAALVLLG
ncbi:DUF2158 domain-containing protein [Pseudomonas syringae]|uniref:DUF2158 domain-containing protein n=1 Tax=Pseudomonas syringae TaxID=317 RepID=UPI000BB5DF64|nr:DUF2158 domain-containing protein [Pseudomonas syringae]PBP44207.1 hypothetical protein CCL13_17020 [Pseudomonas syringae]